MLYPRLSVRAHRFILPCILSSLLVACGGGGTETAPVTPPPQATNPPPPPIPPDDKPSGLIMPDIVEVIGTGNSGDPKPKPSNSQKSSLLSDYDDAVQRFHVWNAALEPVDSVNMILCFVGQLRADQFVNDAAYVALVDEAKCENGVSGGADPSAGQSSGAIRYTRAIVKSERENNDTPMRVSIWLPEMNVGMDEPGRIEVESIISESVSANKPFGAFTLTYQMVRANGGEMMGGGELKTELIDGSAPALTLYESNAFDNGTESFSEKRLASVVMSADKNSGSAFTVTERSGQFSEGSFEENASFALTYNAQNVLVQSADTVAELPISNGDSASGMCLSRSQFIQAVWRYGLYEADTGAALDLNSGFGFEYDSDNNGSKDAHGYLSYWGLWTDPNKTALSSGTTLTVKDHDSDQSVDYTLRMAPGKLTRFVSAQLALTELNGVRFFWWNNDLHNAESNPAQYQSWLVNYLTQSELSGFDGAGFYVVGGVHWGNSGPQITKFNSVAAVAPDWGNTLNMHSEQLGGPVSYQVGADRIVYFAETQMFGDETQSGELFASGAVSLVCFNDCLKGNLTVADLQTREGAFDNPSMGQSVSYDISATGNQAMTLLRAGDPVRIVDATSRESLQNTAYPWGLHSGPLVTTAMAANVQNPWDIYDPSKVSEYYVWSSGPDPWNQLARAERVDGSIVKFDRPLQFAYVHSNDNDRNGDAGEFDQQTLMLQYGGDGHLGGIPHVNSCESDDSCNGHERWYPAINIADGVRMGPNDRYMIKALDGEQKLRQDDDANACNSMSFQSTAPLPSQINGEVDIGDMPIVTGSPKVIAGVIQ